ncbi:hypothetical protein SERLADRAFT_467455 [Serpula lacrymans var. lacrymans S7.9]|uniref:Uncharacterized protein n=1 Tax=Serpula lacrymans var. lacrymans (strain S7.9) TaxID=578457 RepID=F8NWC7_SERL9|nr:uncharacterized protein SERLADRAFT_467455 [Serpula lacrymans var. lacrymans S7.9]EGO24331.1 hypothetical protein SERLADRAFT_467455 [Serpula lacrymans var. lacrymans S7.9]
MDAPANESTHLTWGNVGLGFSFILFDAFVSTSFGLGVGSSLVTSAVRCIVQLGIVALLLQRVFETNNPWAVGGIACLLNLLGTFETVVNKSKKRFNHMFPSVLLSMIASTIPVSIIGIKYAMSIDPFWKPEQYIPIVGMLCGGTISGIVVSITYVLKELHDNRDKVETYLAFGASRFEACKPIARDALRLALTPTINQMSVIGIIAIPGMMTGAILGGSSVSQAAKLQMVIMFMISASTALASIISTVLTLGMVVDSDHRIRSDRIDVREHALWRGRNWVLGKIASGFWVMVGPVTRPFKKKSTLENGEEGQRLLG